ncbi:MAG TPA: ROK family protein, partial [Euzebya sp.]|nr:ROK family protein [Euzebya sp.]
SDAACACGLRGCLEARIAGPAIAQRWPDPDGRSTHALFSAAAAGDPAGRTLADAVTADIALLVHLVINLTGVGDVMLGGGVAQAHPGLLDGVRRHLDATRRRSPLAAAALDPARVRTAPADSAFGALGAVAIAHQALQQPPVPGAAGHDPLYPMTARVTDAAPPRHDASQAGAGVHQGER